MEEVEETLGNDQEKQMERTKTDWTPDELWTDRNEIFLNIARTRLQRQKSRSAEKRP